MPRANSSYRAVISHIFEKFYRKGMVEFEFEREEISSAVEHLRVKKPKNDGDLIYYFRHRQPLPQHIVDEAPQGYSWLILGAGDARYRFRLSRLSHVVPTPGLIVRKVPDATPGIIEAYALTQEQALLAKIRYNRLIDTFLGLTAYSLQNHLRTKIENYGQIEIDELYIGVSASGSQFVIPVQAKGGSDKLGVIQTIQDITFCKQGSSKGNKYGHLITRAVSAQFMRDSVIALFELDFDGDDVYIVQEKHYRLTPPEEISPADLARYRTA